MILIASAFLRLYGLSRGDTVNDEVFMSFRGLGMMDFDEAQMQTTPLEWYEPNIPFWTRFSFHDHPPLVFLTESISMKIFGENNFAFRLPSALLGIASVYLIYLIGTYIFSGNIGLLAAAILGITLNNVYISRVGMQESYVIFFILLACYLFLKAFDKEKYFIWAGVAAGLGFLAKYNTFILIPIFATYLLLFKRSYIFNKKLWLGIFLSLVIFSPVIIYNIGLYRASGHFDFQFSYIFGQHPEVWQATPGKDIGTIADRVRNFAPRLVATNSWIFLSLFALAVISFIYSLFKNFKKVLKEHGFLIISIFYLVILLLFIGPSYRFLTMLTPFAALAVAVFLVNFYNKFLAANKKNIACGFVAVFFAFEIFYSVNNQIVYYPVGPTPWFSSKVRYENYNWGYNELGDFLNKELEGKMPALTFDMQYKFLNDLRDKVLAEDTVKGLELYPALIIYDGNFDLAAKLWILDRLQIYHGWPVISKATYFDYLNKNGFDFYDRSGFQYHYFILQTNIVPDEAARSLMRGNAISIYNKRGEEVFKVYEF
ncbi:MAG: hypothetical protein Athens101426_400 [Parcubacteria group bacterium Athens1014_26]|nr:MAG: hypothetical protein Athens101426_400 [Parcubacteria group bacterium Athens1014_26]